MDLREIERLLRAFKGGELGEQEAARAIGELGFEDLGHTRVGLLPGGFDEWHDAGLPLSSRSE